ncbi:MAG: hypothetical protein Q8O05_01190 [Chloroflexota bacterium]|nr:hypothetical protein [Chloroflexota bacterium]
MGDIKSAREIALAKIEQLGSATEEERLRWKYVPEGEKLAARYFNLDTNLVTELGQFDEKFRKYVMQGVAEVLVRNIDLPRSEPAKKTTKKAMDGLKVIKTDKVGLENVYTKIRRIFNHYGKEGEQQRQQAYQQLKADVEAKLFQSLQQQYGLTPGMKIDVERQPQFQEEWRRVQAQLEEPYLRLLNEYRQELLGLA